MGTDLEKSGSIFQQVALAAIVLVVAGAILRQCWIPDTKEKSVQKRLTETQKPSNPQEGVAGDPDDPETIYRYILHVIEHGSNRLHFPGGVMEGGYLPTEEAPKVACYVMELGGHPCPHPYPKDAAMFYTSVCGGCHGDDGRGIHGAYPDLTRPRLLGIEAWINSLSPGGKESR